MADICYKTGKEVSIDDFIAVLKKSSLAERRPIHNREVMQAILEHGDVIISAWDGDALVGISTTLTDFKRVAYLADLAVDIDYQRRGICRALIEKTRESLAPTCKIVLLAAPNANEYYPKVGFEHNPRAWVLDAIETP